MLPSRKSSSDDTTASCEVKGVNRFLDRKIY